MGPAVARARQITAEGGEKAESTEPISAGKVERVTASNGTSTLTDQFHRRRLLQSALGAGAFFLLPQIALPQSPRQPLRPGPDGVGATPFSLDLLIERAREQATRPHAPPAIADADIMEALDYDQHNRIRFRPEHGLWQGEDGRSPVQMFFPGRYFKQPVSLYRVENGMAYEVPNAPDLFDIPADSPARQLTESPGFAGFRVLDEESRRDWTAFLGASYWRTSGHSGQFGLSARGLAIDTAIPDGPEEFPLFTHFWLEPGPDGALTAYALLDSPSATGAYRIASRRQDGVIQEVTARIFLRDDVERLGIAPLTSMFWYGKNSPHIAADWRPEVHDSDGLEIVTGAGERIWRPLNNPPHTMANFFSASALQGFGLMQRERDFTQYQDDGVFYERRASAWVAPQEDWGEGAVTLVELRTDDEIHDNIVAFWQPAEPARAGAEYEVNYTLSWLADNPDPARTGRFIATRIGAGGVPGQPRPANMVKLVCDFTAEGLTSKADPAAEVTASQGTLSNLAVYPVVDQPWWRMMFDLDFSGIAEDEDQPIDLRAFVAQDGQAVTETLLLQLFPSQLREHLARRA